MNPNKIIVQSVNPITKGHVSHLKVSLGDGPVLITTHENPDPDAFASGSALRYLIQDVWGIPTELRYTGIVSRAENREILKTLTPEWTKLNNGDRVPGVKCVVFVDYQPGSRKSLEVPNDLPMIVIDHHLPITELSQKAVYADIRPDIGSTVTMIYQYLEASQVNIQPGLATAMFLGIRADTDGLSREATVTDGIAYIKLLSQLDQGLLHKIDSAGIDKEYYQAFCQGIQNARIYGKAIISYLGEMQRPDLTADLADLLFRFENVRVALCSGTYRGELYFSIRTDLQNQDAGILVQIIIFPPGKAGGHGIMAGGQIPVTKSNIKDVVSRMEKHFLIRVGEINNLKISLID